MRKNTEVEEHVEFYFVKLNTFAFEITFVIGFLFGGSGEYNYREIRHEIFPKRDSWES